MTNGIIDLSERERLANLLHCLRECKSLDDVPFALLAEPQPDTRPSVKLVAHYPDCRQKFVSQWSLEKWFERVPTVVALLVFMGVSLSIDEWEAALDVLHDAVWWSWIVFLVGTPLFMLIVVPALFFVVRVGQTHRGRGDLILDLNELRHAGPDGQASVPWRDVYTVTLGDKCRVRVELVSGDRLFVRLSTPVDRDNLIDIVRELIRLHHQDLHGLLQPVGGTSLREDG